MAAVLYEQQCSTLAHQGSYSGMPSARAAAPAIRREGCSARCSWVLEGSKKAGSDSL